VNLLESQDWRLRYGADLSSVSDRAELGTGADALQRPLRSRFQARLTAGVRPQPSQQAHILALESNASFLFSVLTLYISFG
jgi:hypothetical protein